jgi:hypothetical protein
LEEFQKALHQAIERMSRHADQDWKRSQLFFPQYLMLREAEGLHFFHSSSVLVNKVEKAVAARNDRSSQATSRKEDIVLSYSIVPLQPDR